MRALVVGWFSYEGFGATAGDLLARDVVADWLCEAGYPFDVAVAEPFRGGIDLSGANPAAYTDLVFVCGPFGNGWPITELLEAYDHCRLVGVNLSMLQRLDEWNPFDALWERDSDAASRPDLTFAASSQRVPVVGVILVHPQEEYGDRALHAHAGAAIDRLLAGRRCARVAIDTRLDHPEALYTSAEEVESVIAKMDLVVTTRLHGTVLALKCGVPAIAIDPIAGGAKVLRQAQTLGWPMRFVADRIEDAALLEAFDRCLTPAARTMAAECATRAILALDRVQAEFKRTFTV